MTRKRTIKKTTEVSTKKYAYPVEKNIAVTGTRNTGFLDKFPFDAMNPGDSFLIPAKDPLCKNPNTLHYAAKQFAKLKPGFNITTRMQLDKSRRVWRLK